MRGADTKAMPTKAMPAQRAKQVKTADRAIVDDMLEVSASSLTNDATGKL